MQCVRPFSSSANSALTFSSFVNRNPRNLEKLRIAYKPGGYHVEKPGRSFWHKLKLIQSGRHVYASINHFENGEILTASTKEWGVKKQLYRCTDTAAYYNLGRVLAERCLKAGLIEVRSDIVPPKVGGKVDKFLEALQEGGVKLEEPPQYQAPRPSDQYRFEKPWEVTE